VYVEVIETCTGHSVGGNLTCRLNGLFFSLKSSYNIKI